MAIQIPNPGTGNGATGDNEFVLWSKVKDNFSDQTNAASKLIGTTVGQVPLAEGVFTAAYSNELKAYNSTPSDLNSLVDYPLGSRIYLYHNSGTVTNSATGMGLTWVTVETVPIRNGVLQTITTTSKTLWRTANNTSGLVWSAWHEYYSTRNTTKEPTTGYLKAASPILHLFNDDLVKEHEAVEQDITVEKLGTGDYLIKGSTGLSNEGWNLSPPKDIHGNVLCMVEATESDGNINVKTYKRKFDFDIVAIVPDYDQPFDIPDGHSVDLRLNVLPQETQTEV